MLEVIENSCKSVLCSHIWDIHKNNLWYTNLDTYIPKYAHKRLLDIDKTTNVLKKNDVTSKKYFKENPHEKYLPEYIFFDKLTFWWLIFLFKDLKTPTKKSIARHYWVNYLLLENRIDCLRYLRNLCSHYEPIFFRKMLYAIKWFEVEESIWSRNTCGTYFLLVWLMQKIIMPNYNRNSKVHTLMEKFSISYSDIWIQNKNLPSKHELDSEAWEVLLTEVYQKNVKLQIENKETKKESD